MKLEVIESSTINKSSTILVSSNELLAFLITNQDKILNKQWAIALVLRSSLDNPETEILDLKHNVVLLNEEYQNLRTLLFNSKFDNLIKE